MRKNSFSKTQFDLPHQAGDIPFPQPPFILYVFIEQEISPGQANWKSPFSNICIIARVLKLAIFFKEKENA